MYALSTSSTDYEKKEVRSEEVTQEGGDITTTVPAESAEYYATTSTPI